MFPSRLKYHYISLAFFLNLFAVQLNSYSLPIQFRRNTHEYVSIPNRSVKCIMGVVETFAGQAEASGEMRVVNMVNYQPYELNREPCKL
jgi:hypothetical protein